MGGPPAYAVPCQILVDIAGHEDHSQVFSHAERADGQFMAVDVGELLSPDANENSGGGKTRSVSSR